MYPPESLTDPEMFYQRITDREMAARRKRRTRVCRPLCVCVWSQTRAVPCMRLQGYGPSKPHASTRLVLLNAEPRAKGDRPLQLHGPGRPCQPFGLP